MDRVIVKGREYVPGEEIIARGQVRDIYEAACRKGFSNSQTADTTLFIRGNELARVLRVNRDYRLVILKQVSD